MINASANESVNRTFIQKLISIKNILCFFSLIILISISTIVFISNSNTIAPKGIIIHHSAVPFKIISTDDVELIDEVHKMRGFSIFYWGENYHIGYHYLILPDGKVVQGRPEKCRGAHTTGYNDFIGICLIGNFANKSLNNDSAQEEPTFQQLESLKTLVKTLELRYQIQSEYLLKHNEVNQNTECPGDSSKLQETLTDLQSVMID